MATCGVYKITNIITNECYIGCSNNVERVVRKIFQDAGNKAIIDELNKVKLCK